MGSIFLTHLHSAWHVDQAILHEENPPKLIVIRFGRAHLPECMAMDELLYRISDRCQKFATFYVVDTKEVPDFNGMYELYDACSVMFFWRNKHMQCDFGTGNNNKINFPIGDKQELIDIIEVVYRGAKKGVGLVVSPKDYSTAWKY